MTTRCQCSALKEQVSPSEDYCMSSVYSTDVTSPAVADFHPSSHSSTHTSSLSFNPQCEYQPKVSRSLLLFLSFIPSAYIHIYTPNFSATCLTASAKVCVRKRERERGIDQITVRHVGAPSVWVLVTKGTIYIATAG